jgi:hypothetical protein
MEVWFAAQSPSPPNITLSRLRSAQERASGQQLYQLIAKRRLQEFAFVGWKRNLRELTQCLENTVCNETETDAKRSLVSHDREKCVYHPTTDGQGGQDGANTSQGDRVVNVPFGSGSSLDWLALGVGLAS